jgi:hypothetical protein
MEGLGTDLTDFRKHVLHTPDLSLTAETVLTAELELLVKTLLLERSSDGTIGLAICEAERMDKR